MRQLGELQDHLREIEGTGARLVVVSSDDRSDLDATRDRMLLTYPMVSDPDLEVAEDYGVREKWRNAALPATFVVGEDGRIRFVHVARNPIDRLSVAALLIELRR